MRWTLTCAALLIAFCSASAEPVKCPPAASSLDVSNGNYTSQPGIVFHLENFSAKMVPIGKRMPLCLAKTTDISQGQVFVTAESLTNLFTSKSSPSHPRPRSPRSSRRRGRPPRQMRNRRRSAPAVARVAVAPARSPRLRRPTPGKRRRTSRSTAVLLRASMCRHPTSRSHRPARLGLIERVGPVSTSTELSWSR